MYLAWKIDFNGLDADILGARCHNGTLRLKLSRRFCFQLKLSHGPVVEAREKLELV